MKIKLLALACLLALQTMLVRAELQLPGLFNNHMVLQRGCPIPVWGTSDPGATVQVQLGSETVSANADATGKWIVQLSAREASEEPLEMNIYGDGTSLSFKDVLIGDVWLAAGQSNMDFAFFWSPSYKQAQEEFDFPLIRYFKVGTVSMDKPRPMIGGGWTICQPKNIMGFTIVGAYFAREIHEKLHIPIGIINSSWGGTSVQAWMSESALAADPAGPAIIEKWQKVLQDYPERKEKYDQAKEAWSAEKQAAKDQGLPFKKPMPNPPNGPGSNQAPSGLFNAMIHPLIPYALRGIIWYQGENNARQPADYRTLFPALIADWRMRWKQGNIPFYWVQLPGYNTVDGDWAGLREAQTLTLAVPNTAQAITIDNPETNNIHPANKKEVGHRLALLALARTYECKDVIDSGPVFERADFTKNPVQLHFKSVYGGLHSPKKEMPIGGFEVAGEDKKFYPATAQINPDQQTISVSSPSVSNPVAVRYAWKNNLKDINIVNSADLPLAPFRTDNW